MTWREAYFEQAKSDFRQFQKLNEESAELCHQLHYLQMATEKLAKAHRCPPGNTPPAMVHNMFVRFLQTCRRMPQLQDAMGFAKARGFPDYVDHLLPKAQQIEELAPAGGAYARPNPEYPWQPPGVPNVESPLKYGFAHLDIQGREFREVLRVVSALIHIGLL